MAKDEIYRELIIELYRNPPNAGRIAGADYRGAAANATCGDEVEIFLKVKDGVVSEAKFAGSGCAISQASASLLAGHVKGRRLASLGRLGRADVFGLLGVDLGKNPARVKCALLPLDALKAALARGPKHL